MLGEIKLFAGGFTPLGFLACDGKTLPSSDYSWLSDLLKNTYGGDGINTFAVPNLQGLVPVCAGQLFGEYYEVGMTGGEQMVSLSPEHVGVHTHLGQFAQTSKMQIDLQIQASTGLASSTSPAGNMFAHSPAGYEMYNNTPPDINEPIAMQGMVRFTTSQQTVPDNKKVNKPHLNDQPYQCINYIIDAYGGSYERFVGEICIFPYNFIPANFVECNGAELDFVQYPILYALLGNTYGSSRDGVFALPDLRGRVAAGYAYPQTHIYSRSLGESGGMVDVQLTADQIPEHTHPIEIGITGKVGWPVTPNVANTGNPGGAMLAKVGGQTMYNTTSNSTMAEVDGGKLTGVMNVLSNSSPNSAHNNVQPVMGLTYAICIDGTFPTRQ
ncbi:MAG: tail fiber protein [Bacteroidetes bacterium]|nr:tail fiber protein [Bacteroidota bacterium]